MNQSLSPLENQSKWRETMENEYAHQRTQSNIEPGDVALEVLGEIARGRKDCGKPLNAEEARQLARTTLMSLGRMWPQNSKAAS
jgi:hypothetical protein